MRPRSHPRETACAPALPRLLLTLLILIWSIPAAAELTVRLSQQQVAAGQAVELILTRTDAPTDQAPDLTALEVDFHIIGRSSGERVSIVNGRRMAQQELRLQLLPLRSGRLEVPSIGIGAEETPVLTLDVAHATNPNARLLPAPPPTAPSAADLASSRADLRIQARLTPKRLMVDQQAVLVVRVLAAGAQPEGRLHDPMVAGARLLPLGEERLSERLGDTDYAVYQRHYALFPSRPGALAIEPIRFDLWRPGQAGPQTVASEALAAQVQPIPAAAADKGWLPARSVTLTESGPAKLRVAPGQVHERQVTLRVEGVMAEDLPEISLQAPVQVRQRADRTRRWNERLPDGVVGYRSERVLISAAENGNFQLPGPQVHWWDTEAGRWQQAALPALTLEVQPLRAAALPSVPDWDDSRRQADGPVLAPSADPVTPTQGDVGGRWLWISGAGLLALLLVGWLMSRWRRGAVGRAPTTPEQQPRTPLEEPGAESEPDPMDEVIDRVAAGYRDGNAGAVRAALLDWARLVWPQGPPANLARLTVQCEGPLRKRIKLLEKAFFSPTPITWDTAPETVADELRAAADAAGAGSPADPAPPAEPASRRS